jgi:hypothetical protein
MLKGQDGVSTETIGEKFRPKQSAAYVGTLASVQSRVKNLLCNKQETCRCKMVGTGIQSFAKLLVQIVRGMPQTTQVF